MADGSMVHKGIKGMSLSLDSICYMGFICIYIYIYRMEMLVSPI